MAESWLQRKFTEFFVEVQRQAVAIRTGRWELGEEPQRVREMEDYRGKGPDAAWDAIAMVIRRQEAEARETQAVVPEVYKEAQYAMVCLAHDVFVVQLGDWPGRQGWLDMPLEKAFFNSNAGGGEIFRRISKVLSRHDPADRDLARVYFNMLSLGFVGKYGGRSAAGRTPPEIEDLRKRLSGAYDGFGGRVGEVTGEISRQPYETVKTGEADGKVRMPGAGQSLFFLAVAAGILILVMLISVKWLRSDIEGSLNEIDLMNKDAAARE